MLRDARGCSGRLGDALKRPQERYGRCAWDNVLIDGLTGEAAVKAVGGILGEAQGCSGMLRDAREILTVMRSSQESSKSADSPIKFPIVIN